MRFGVSRQARFTSPTLPPTSRAADLSAPQSTPPFFGQSGTNPFRPGSPPANTAPVPGTRNPFSMPQGTLTPFRAPEPAPRVPPPFVHCQPMPVPVPAPFPIAHPAQAFSHNAFPQPSAATLHAPPALEPQLAERVERQFESMRASRAVSRACYNEASMLREDGITNTSTLHFLLDRYPIDVVESVLAELQHGPR